MCIGNYFCLIDKEGNTVYLHLYRHPSEIIVMVKSPIIRPDPIMIIEVTYLQIKVLNSMV